MKYYTCANTSQGYCDFTNENVFDVQRVVEIKCSNPYITNWVTESICKTTSEAYDTIIYPGSFELRSGIVFSNRKKAFVSNYPGADESINLDKYFELMPAYNHTENKKKDMYAAYAKAKLVHDEWERIYISSMDFLQLDKFCENTINALVTAKSETGNGKVYKRFFGTTTPEGAGNFIDDITQTLNKRYFIKGRPGTGKSTFLKKLSKALTENGYNIEQYYCSFDARSLDMVVCRELSFGVFDSTSPHEKFPERQNDEILDFYIESGLEGTDEKFRKELAEIKKAYDTFIKSGKKAFKEAMSIENNEYIKQFEKVKNTADIKLLF